MPSDELQLVIELCQMSLRKRRAAPGNLLRAQELYARYEALAKNPTPADLREDAVDINGLRARWLAPPDAPAADVMLYLHGGCYVAGSIETHHNLMARLAAVTPIRVLGIDYRCAPTQPFPAALDDTVAAYRWLLERRVAPRRIVIAGDSAGGGLGLAAMVALRDRGEPLPAAAVCMSPWVDLEVSGELAATRPYIDPIITPEMLRNNARLYLGERSPRTPLASPLYAELHGLPPLLIQVGAAEIMLDDAARLAARAQAAGVAVSLEVWPEMIHGWQDFAAILTEARAALEQIGGFVRTHLGR